MALVLLGEDLNFVYTYAEKCSKLTLSTGLDWLKDGIGIFDIESLTITFDRYNSDGTYDSEDIDIDFQTAALTGTIEVTDGLNTVAGSGTTFLTDFSRGDYIVILESGVGQTKEYYYKIDNITSDTALTLTTNYTEVQTGAGPYAACTYYKLNNTYTIEDTDFTGGSIRDGLYSIDFVIEGEEATTPYSVFQDDSFIYTEEISLLCHVENCVDTLFCNLPKQMCNNCNYTEYVENALFADALLKSLQVGSLCLTAESFYETLDLLTTICEFNNCETC